jgi:hypothetical protein
VIYFQYFSRIQKRNSLIPGILRATFFLSDLDSGLRSALGSNLAFASAVAKLIRFLFASSIEPIAPCPLTDETADVKLIAH